MRVIDATTQALLDSGKFTVHKRFNIRNGSGTFVSLDGLYVSGSFTSPDPYKPIPSLTLRLIRETKYDGTDSLAPTVTASTYNRLDDGVTYSPLIELGREVTFDVAYTAVGGARPPDNSALWYQVFHGVVQKFDWPKMDTHNATLQCIGWGATLGKSEAAYIYPQGVSIEATAQAVLDNNGHPTEEVYAPVATGKVLTANYGPGVQKQIWDQIQSLAHSIGFVSWYRYAADGSSRINIFEPDRDKVVSDYTVPYLVDYDQLTIDAKELGNVARAVYTDMLGVRRDAGPIVDQASIDRYGGFRRPYWINFAPDSPVRSEADALAVLTKAVSDTSHPDAVATAPIPFNPFLENAVDLITLPADPRFFGESLDMAPFSMTHNFSVDQEDVTITQLRDKPSAGYRTWRGGTSTSSRPFRPRPSFDTFRQAEGVDSLHTDVSVEVNDTLARPGRLRVWVNKADVTNPDPAGPEDGYLDIDATPYVVQASTVFTSPASNLFDNIRIHPTHGKDIFLEYTTEDGDSSGVHRYALRGPGGIVDDNGDIVDGAIDNIDAFGPNVLAIAEAADEADLANLSLLTRVAYIDGELWRRQADNSWSKAVQSVDIVGEIVATTVAEGSLTTAHFAQGIEPVGLASGSLPTSKTTEIVYLDGTLYTWNATDGNYQEYVAAVGSTTIVNTENIADEAVTAAKLGAQAVTTVKIALAAVTADLLAAAAVTSAKIADEAITAAKIGAQAVQTANIALEAVTQALIGAGAVGATQLANGAVELTKFASGLTPVEIVGTLPSTGNYAGRTVMLTTDNKLYRHTGTDWTAAVPTTDLTGTIASGQIGAGAVGVSHLEDGAVTAVKFANGLRPVEVLTALPTSGNIQGRTVFLTTDNKLYRYTGTGWTVAVPTSDLSGTIETAQLADSAITAAKIGAAAVTTAKIANDAITAALIAAGTITGTEISDSAISSPKIAAGAVVAGKIGAGAVTATEIAANTITAAQIAANAITASELAADSVSAVHIVAGSITADRIAANSLTAGQIAAGAIGASEIAADAVTAVKIAANVITAAHIAANTITTAQIAAGAITATEIAAGAITASKLAVGFSTGAALNADPGPTEMSAWALHSGAASIVTVTGKTHTQALRSYSGSPAWVYSQTRIPVDDTKTYRVRTWAASASANGTFYLAVKLTDGAGANIAGDGTWWYYAASGAALPATWTAYSGTFGAGTAKPIPSNARYMQVGLILNYTATTGYHYAQDIRIEEVLPGTLIQDGAITTDKIAANAVTASKIVAGSVTAAAIEAGAITTAKIATGAVTANEIASNAITAVKILAGSITGDRMAANTITASHIAAGAITADEIATGAVSAVKIAASAVTAEKIAGLTITGDKIAANAITTSKIAAGSIGASHIASNSLTAGTIAAGAIGASEIAAGAVQTDKLAAGAITAAKIASNTITASQIAADTITAGQIATNAITANELAANAVTAAHIVAGTITGDKIAANAITADKISVSDLSAINATFSGTLNGVTGTFAGTVTANSFTGSNPNFSGRIRTNSIDIYPTYISGIYEAARVYNNSGGFAGAIRPTTSGSSWGAGIELNGSNNILLNPHAGTVTGSTKNFGYFDMWYGTSNFWRWDPGFGGTTSELRLLRNGTTLLYRFAATGQAYADLGWSTFSPEPPKPAAEMTLQDWIDWAAEDATKPNKPYEGIPTADNPNVIAIAEQLGVSRTVAAEMEEDKYSKDISKISIGFGMALKLVVEAAAASSNWGDFRNRLRSI